MYRPSSASVAFQNGNHTSTLEPPAKSSANVTVAEAPSSVLATTASATTSPSTKTRACVRSKSADIASLKLMTKSFTTPSFSNA